MTLPDTLPAALAGALSARGYTDLTQVQSAVLVSHLSDKDLLVSAQTGSGKTVAFGLAMAEALLSGEDTLAPASAPLALIVAPTRELAVQVARELAWLYGIAGARLATCVGGMDMRDERRALERGAHIVIGTPGRLADHIKRGSLVTGGVRVVVLDEADEMLDMGFREELELILEGTPEERRTLMFSATVPKGIAALAARYQKNAARVTTDAEKSQHVDIEYKALLVAPGDEENAIVNIVRHSDSESALVFCSTRAAVNKLMSRMGNRGFPVVALSGELSQKERSNALQALRDGRARVCIATDVAARGLDLQNLGLVIHADLPRDPATLLHRSGRTGRAGRKGDAILFIKPNERRVLASIERATGGKLEVYTVPTTDEVNASRIDRFKESVKETMDAGEDRSMYARIVQEIAAESGKELVEVATALAEMATGDSSLLFQAEGAVQGRERTEDEHNSYMNDRGGNRGRYDRNDRNDRGPQRSRFGNDDRGGRFERNDRGPRPERSRFGSDDRGGRSGNDQGGRFGSDQGGRFGDKRAAFAGDRAPRGDDRGGRFGGDQGGRFGSDQGGRFGDRRESKPMPGPSDEPGMIRYRVEVGRQHGVNPGNIVGAVANEGDISSQFIGRIEIFDNFSTIDLPEGMPQDTFRKLQRTNVRGQQLRIAELNAGPGPRPGRGNYTSPNDRV